MTYLLTRLESQRRSLMRRVYQQESPILNAASGAISITRFGAQVSDMANS